MINPFTVLLGLGLFIVLAIIWLLDILFLKWAYQKATKSRITYGKALLQWLFLLIFKIVIALPLAFLLGSLALIAFIVGLILDILFMKYSADLAYKKKHTFVKSFYQWAWLLLFRLIALVLAVLIILIILLPFFLLGGV